MNIKNYRDEDIERLIEFYLDTDYHDPILQNRVLYKLWEFSGKLLEQV